MRNSGLEAVGNFSVIYANAEQLNFQQSQAQHFLSSTLICLCLTMGKVTSENAQGHWCGTQGPLKPQWSHDRCGQRPE